eukprot:9989617-Heterocapsa_arctica.AAC.1
MVAVPVVYLCQDCRIRALLLNCRCSMCVLRRGASAGEPVGTLPAGHGQRAFRAASGGTSSSGWSGT